MDLTPNEQAILDGAHDRAAQKAMQILVALGTIYDAQRLIPVTSVQVAGVSYDNLGEAGLRFLAEMADGGGQACVKATLNPAGMDIENWSTLGIPEEFAEKQLCVISAFTRMGIQPTCTCTPYLVGNQPGFGEHIAWSESSAVCYANAVLGARSNREGGPSALAAALTGLTPEYGLHLDENRHPGLSVYVDAKLTENTGFGALGKVIGDEIQADKRIPYIIGIETASLEQLKSFCASLATYGGVAMFHMAGITPEAGKYKQADESLTITQTDLDNAARSLWNAAKAQVDFVSLGCPHLTLNEIAHIADLLKGKQVTREFWITTARPVKELADHLGYTRAIIAAGGKIAADTCCVVAPIKGRFTTLATDSAKACFYAAGKHNFKTVFLPFSDVVRLAIGELG